jgi:hypothetical protein
VKGKQQPVAYISAYNKVKGHLDAAASCVAYMEMDFDARATGDS